MLKKSIIELGNSALCFFKEFGKAGVFFASILWQKPKLIKRLPLLIKSIYNLGVNSLLVVSVSALFIGMVMALQGYYNLQRFGAEVQLGQWVALSIFRELGPVVTALLFAGRAGSSLTAEIGLMQTTDQISSLEIMAVDPLEFVVWPRFWAGFISLPLLTVVFNALAIYGGYLIGVMLLGIDNGTYWSNTQASVDWYQDLGKGLIKSLFFAVLVLWVALYQGYNTFPSAEGIGRASTKTVVYASLAVLGADFILTALMVKGW